MRLALIADIHGNSWALEAVLDDVARQRTDLTINLGDVFSGPLDAAGTFRLLQPLGLPTVRGNHDRYLIEQRVDDMAPSDRVAFEMLPNEAIAWLTTLPQTSRPIDGVYACHATPRLDDRYWMERVEPNGLVRKATHQEVEAELNEDALAADLVVCAHTHLHGVRRLANGALLVNPGSVGCPAYDDTMPYPHHMESGFPQACYAIVERRSSGWQASFRLVVYDSRPAIRSAQSHGRLEWATGLRTGYYAP
ncbi:MAG: metallophosphoesterase family protein [Pseudomonadota bacterium]